MMKTDVKDVQWCAQGSHIVPRETMTRMLADNGKAWRHVCTACKDSTYERRSKAKRNSLADAKAPSASSGA
jgi:hypothetical protein